MRRSGGGVCSTSVKGLKMGVEKRVMCLANSRKLSGRCVAGVEIVDEKTAGWIRPISDRENMEVSEWERQYENGRDPKVMDIIGVPLLRHKPWRYQNENWLLDSQYYWRKINRARWEHLAPLVSADYSLWIDGFSTSHGKNDRIPDSRAESLDDSLRLVHVDRISLRVFAPGEEFGNRKRRVQARFDYMGTEYALWVTDPECERKYLPGFDGEYSLGERYMTISLGEPYRGHVYKIVAAIIERG